MQKYEVFPTVAWSAGPGCHGGCGQKLFIKDGRLMKVEGDEDHPFNQGRSCPRVLALTQYMYHPDRITRPLKRVGERGEGKFEPITWDEAYDTCERRLNEIRERYGPEAVVFAQGTGRDIGGPISFLAYSFGSPNWCQPPDLLVGAGVAESDRRRRRPRRSTARAAAIGDSRRRARACRHRQCGWAALRQQPAF